MFKNKRNLAKKLCVVCFIGLLFLAIINFPHELLADVGNNNRYESGSSFDRYESGSSFDSYDGDSSGDAFIVFYLFELLLRLIFIFGPIPGVIMLIVLVVIFSIWYRKHGKKINQVLSSLSHKTTKRYTVNLGESYLSEEEVTNKIQEIDPNFSSDKFIGWTREVFIKLQQAWTERNWKIIRPFETEELFSQHNAQLEEYIKNGRINKIEKINVKYCKLRNFEVDGDKEVLTVELYAIMRDYVVDEKTNKVLESDPNRDWHMKYIMTFNRKHGVKTDAGVSNKSTTNCPNCGAPTEITSAGQCEYCGSVITTGEHDWVLSDIRSI